MCLKIKIFRFHSRHEVFFLSCVFFRIKLLLLLLLGGGLGAFGACRVLLLDSLLHSQWQGGRQITACQAPGQSAPC